MFPLIAVGALGAIAIAHDLLHPDSKRERIVEEYKKGRISGEEASEQINEAYLQPQSLQLNPIPIRFY